MIRIIINVDIHGVIIVQLRDAIIKLQILIVTLALAIIHVISMEVFVIIIRAHVLVFLQDIRPMIRIMIKMQNIVIHLWI